jgi:hypothetical protein
MTPTAAAASSAILLIDGTSRVFPSIFQERDVSTAVLWRQRRPRSEFMNAQVNEAPLMRFLRSCAFLLCFSSWTVVAEDAFKVEELKQAPPSSLAPDVARVLNGHGYRIIDDQGKPFAEIWLRKSVPASARPAGAKGVIQFPFLAESELLGVMQLMGEAHDYRDQAIAKGAYTMRYGLQPVNGDHLGVSPYRDYALLLPGAKDKAVAMLPRKQLETQSAESAGSSHPACFFMLAVPSSSAQAAPTMIHDAEKNTWRVVLPLGLEVKGESKPLIHPISIIVAGISESS